MYGKSYSSNHGCCLHRRVFLRVALRCAVLGCLLWAQVSEALTASYYVRVWKMSATYGSKVVLTCAGQNLDDLADNFWNVFEYHSNVQKANNYFALASCPYYVPGANPNYHYFVDTISSSPCIGTGPHGMSVYCTYADVYQGENKVYLANRPINFCCACAGYSGLGFLGFGVSPTTYTVSTNICPLWVWGNGAANSPVSGATPIFNSAGTAIVGASGVIVSEGAGGGGEVPIPNPDTGFLDPLPDVTDPETGTSGSAEIISGLNGLHVDLSGLIQSELTHQALTTDGNTSLGGIFLNTSDILSDTGQGVAELTSIRVNSSSALSVLQGIRSAAESADAGVSLLGAAVEAGNSAHGGYFVTLADNIRVYVEAATAAQSAKIEAAACAVVSAVGDVQSAVESIPAHSEGSGGSVDMSGVISAIEAGTAVNQSILDKFGGEVSIASDGGFIEPVPGGVDTAALEAAAVKDSLLGGEGLVGDVTGYFVGVAQSLIGSWRYLGREKPVFRLVLALPLFGEWVFAPDLTAWDWVLALIRAVEVAALWAGLIWLLCRLFGSIFGGNA